jgi:type I restriction enzyme S subunit
MPEQVGSLKTGAKFKDTPIGRIPVDWEVVELGNICSISSGAASNYLKDIKKEPYPVYGSNGVIGSYNQSNFSDGLVIGRVRTSGSIQIISSPIWATDNTLLISITDSFTNKSFIYHYLQKYNLSVLATKTAQPLLTQGNLKRVLIGKPPYLEQKKIAEILLTVDEAVEKTAQIIEKIKEVKKGLMQKLLTRGIGHKKFKKTGIGEIPLDWSIRSIGDLCEILDSARVPLNKEQREKMKGKIPYYGANGIVDYINDFIFDDDLILMAEAGGYFEEYKSRPIAYLIHGKSWVNNHAHVLKVKEPNDNLWVYYSLVHKNIIPFIKGGTRSKLNQEELRQITILLPAASEQKEIAEILSSVDKEIEKETSHKDQLEWLKKGLMQVLLTGQVRVNV